MFGLKSLISMFRSKRPAKTEAPTSPAPKSCCDCSKPAEPGRSRCSYHAEKNRQHVADFMARNPGYFSPEQRALRKKIAAEKGLSSLRELDADRKTRKQLRKEVKRQAKATKAKKG